MTNVVLLIISLAAALGGSIIKKYYMSKSEDTLASVFTFNAIGSVVSALVLLVWGGIESLSVFTVLLGILFGIVTILQAITNLRALRIGPMSYTSIIISFSTLISAVSGALFFNEQIELAHIIGMVFMLISFVLAVEPKSDEKGMSMRWLALCLAAFLFTGGIGIMQKVHQTSSHKGELNAFLVVAFAVSAILSAIVALFLKKKESPAAENAAAQAEKPSGKLVYILVAVMLLNGVCVAVNNKLNLFLSGELPAAVFFPIVNGGGLILTTLAALILFRERLTKKQWVGVVAGVISILFLCNPF